MGGDAAPRDCGASVPKTTASARGPTSLRPSRALRTMSVAMLLLVVEKWAVLEKGPYPFFEASGEKGVRPLFGN